MAAKGRLAQLRRGLAAVGGVFVPIEPVARHTYDLTDRAYAEGLAGAASVVDPDDLQAVTALVNRWGHLGVGPTKDAPSKTVPALMGLLTLPACDAFNATRNELKSFQLFVQYLVALKQAGTERTWRMFIERLEPNLSSLRPAVRWSGRAPAPAWLIETPRALLWATLWDWTTGVGDLRRCPYPRCGAYFLADHPRKVYCSPSCTRKAGSARWYREKGREQRRRARQGDHARNRQDPHAEVRKWGRAAQVTRPQRTRTVKPPRKALGRFRSGPR